MAFRGVGLVISQSYEVGLPENIRVLGNAYLGPLFLDVVIGILIIVFLYLIQSRTVFGTHIMALGNNVENSIRLGIQANKITFLTFVSAGFIASIGGMLSLLQTGRFTVFLGQGYEFTAVAAVVLGGISLFGGEGKIFPGVLIGVFTLELIRNGLNHVSANPYLYGFVNGGIIFLAMSFDALKTRSRGRIRVIDEDSPLEAIKEVGTTSIK
jgi:ribose/xylose/arabinose/galactoside ABC-type transport system permease subunit